MFSYFNRKQIEQDKKFYQDTKEYCAFETMLVCSHPFNCEEYFVNCVVDNSKKYFGTDINGIQRFTRVMNDNK